MLSVCCSTHPGSVRTVNEDCATFDSTLSFCAVADGMGGHKAGEVASRMALDAITAFMRQSAVADDGAWPFAIDTAASLEANRLTTAVKLANRCVYRASRERTDYSGMGTTIVIALADGAHVTFANVGDSRLYTMRNHRLWQLSRDDSWVNMLSQESGVDPSAFREHPMRNVLTNVVGPHPEVSVALGDFDLVEGQLILLCTDGLHGGTSDDQMSAILRSETDLQRAADRLVQMGVAQDGRDNVTVVLARYSELPYLEGFVPPAQPLVPSL